MYVLFKRMRRLKICKQKDRILFMFGKHRIRIQTHRLNYLNNFTLVKDAYT